MPGFWKDFASKMALMMGVVAFLQGCSLSQRAPSGMAKITLSPDLQKKLLLDFSRQWKGFTTSYFYVIEVSGEGIPTGQVRAPVCPFIFSSVSAIARKETFPNAELTLEVPVGKNRRIRVLGMTAEDPLSSPPSPLQGENALSYFARTGDSISSDPDLWAEAMIPDLTSDQDVDLLVSKRGIFTCDGFVPSETATPVLEAATNLQWQMEGVAPGEGSVINGIYRLPPAGFSRKALPLNWTPGVGSAWETIYLYDSADCSGDPDSSKINFTGRNDPGSDWSGVFDLGVYSFKVFSATSDPANAPPKMTKWSSCSPPLQVVSDSPHAIEFELYENGVLLSPGSNRAFHANDKLQIAVVLSEKIALLSDPAPNGLMLNNKRSLDLVSIAPSGLKPPDKKPRLYAEYLVTAGDGVPLLDVDDATPLNLGESISGADGIAFSTLELPPMGLDSGSLARFGASIDTGGTGPVENPPPPPQAKLSFSGPGESVVYGDALTPAWSYPGETAATPAAGVAIQSLRRFSGAGCLGTGANPVQMSLPTIRAYNSPLEKFPPGDYSFRLTTSNSSGESVGSNCASGKLLAPKAVSLVSGGMAVGADHTCVLSDGKVYCWGKNDHGQLGDGDPISSGAKREFPRPVLLRDGSELTGVEKISSSKNHTCALRIGRVYCWGANDHSQLGVAGGDRPEAVAVSGDLTGVQEVSAGADHTCAIVNGGIRCWGGNAHGQIGVNAVSEKSSAPVLITMPYPIPNSPVLGASKIAAGDSFTCAIIEGHVKCWGRNDQGQSGKKRMPPTDTADVAFPEWINNSPYAQGIVAGSSHACMLSNGQILCWGSNANGQLGVLGGVSGTLDSDEPIALQGAQANALQDFQRVYAGGDSTCGLKAGGLWCTGKGSDGQLGNGLAANSFGVVSASSTFSGALLFGIGSGHSCAITSAGMFCAGKNDSFQLGHPEPPIYSKIAIKFDAFTPGLQMVATGREFTCILVKGEVWCTGKNDFHQLGNVDSQYSASALFPIQVQMVDPSQPSVYRPLDRVTAITAGLAHVCAIRDGGLWCWGRVYHPPTTVSASMRRVGAVTLGFQIQDVTYSVATSFSSVATTADSQDVGDLSVGVSAISSSFDHTCAIKRGKLLCWGVNGSGQLGNGTKTSQGLPTRVMQTAAYPLMDVSSVSAGKDHTCAIASGQVFCFGSNLSGQLGNGTLSGTDIASVSPLLPSNLLLKGVQSVSAGDAHTCAVVNGTAMCWGANGTVQSGTFVSDSRLGISTSSGELYPIDALDGVSKVSSIVAGSTFTLAVTSGGVLGFGNNSQGQLGLNSTFSGVSPLLVPNLNEGFGVLQVSVGGAHSCAIAGKQVYCSGSNSFGQLGRRNLGLGTSSTVFDAITAPWDPTP